MKCAKPECQHAGTCMYLDTCPVQVKINSAFPLLIFYLDARKCDLIRVSDKLPVGSAFIVLKTQATPNDLILPNKILEAIANDRRFNE